jgi:hypothetical protein
MPYGMRVFAQCSFRNELRAINSFQIELGLVARGPYWFVRRVFAS